jgi:hypothetical protein
VPLIELLRISFAFCCVFLLVPAFAEAKNSRRYAWDSAAGALQLFVHASLAVEVVCLLLGRLGLCLPGVVVSLCGVLVLQGMSRRSAYSGRNSLWPLVLLFFEDVEAAKCQVKRTFRKKIGQVCGGKLGILVALYSSLVFLCARYALTHVHFAYAQTYNRAISLGVLSQGQSWQVDSSVALLAPLAFFSGMDVASVLRFSGPIFTAAFILILSVFVFRVWGSITSAVGAAVLFAAVLSLAPATIVEFTPALASNVYWIAAAALWPISRRDSVFAILLAAMLSPIQWVWVTAFGLLALATVAAAGVRKHALRKAAACLPTLICALTMGLFTRVNARPVQIIQYESTARICDQIARRFPRKQWIIVSPFQELALIYGRGWHVELSDFISSFTPNQVSNLQFQFPYDCPDVFVFIERRPMMPGDASSSEIHRAIWHYSPAEVSDWPTFLYADPIGRQSLQYRAAALMNAYARYHKNVVLFYADEDILVYRIIRLRKPL